MKEKESYDTETNYMLLFKTFLLGALFTELFIFSEVIGKMFVEISIHEQKESWLWVIGILYSIMIVFYTLRKNLWVRSWIIIKSLRFDLLIVIFLGMFLVFSFGGFGIKFLKSSIKMLTWLQLLYIISIPVIIFISLFLKNIQATLFKNNGQESLFLSDREGKNKNDDKFNFLNKAEKFAEGVFNHGSPESLVFGIDAPWGTGKSTFVNLCKEYWRENYGNEIIIYNFDPLRYENKEHLLEKFIEGLIKEIRNHVFEPEIVSLASRYARLLKDSKASFSFLGISFGLTFGSQSVDVIFKRLESILQSINKKVVIIIDDLDRLSFSSIKELLFVMKKAFMLPNISYVLCYDTENITLLEEKKIQTENITEFLEKFINVKISLYLDNKLLLQYFTENKDESLSKNMLANPKLVSKAVEGLKDIFESRDFHYYIPFIGDARKLKRLINTIILLEVDKTDFNNCDFNKEDLINLLLIYINYPNIFRKIYNTETQVKKGFFSLVSKFEEGYPENDQIQVDKNNKYMNSVDYTNYLKNLSENQKFILNRVFDLNQRLKNLSKKGMEENNITQEMITSYACFNGSMWSTEGRNLESYLNLITNVSKPIKTKQYRFYVNLKNKILLGKNIKEIFNDKEFSFSKSESSHEQLWRVLVNSSHNEFAPKKSEEIICYAVNNLPQYSIFEAQNIEIGLRNILPFFIVKLLDQIGWSDELDKHFNNIDENIKEIAEWIFGEGDHSKEGILDILGKEGRGIIGMYDLLLFRLYCCADRGGDIFNLSRSLSKHGNPQAPTSGDTRKIVIEEMREISQYVFKIFETQFINRNRNVFEEIDKLTIKDVCGEYYNFVNLNIELGNIDDVDMKLSVLKSKMKAFIIYQLGNTISENGIGCGYYDAEGNKDEKGICQAINEYLFGYCFNPQKNENNYRNFLDYMLTNLSQTIGSQGSFKLKANINGFTKVLDKDRLTAYWKEHYNTIMAKNFKSESRKIFTGNYTTSYVEALDDVYEVLNELENGTSKL